MTPISTIAAAAAVTVVLALPASAAAQMPDTRDRTIMTFSAPVELPGLRLEAGTYVFKLADTSSRNVVQVFTADETEILGQWLFIPAERQEVTGDTVVTFRETSAGSTPAVQYWFYPGERIGKEFIYPKDQAMRIAQRTGTTVQSDDGPVAADARASAEVEVAPAQEQGAVAVRRDDIGVVEGVGLPREEPQPIGTAGSAEPADQSVDRPSGGADAEPPATTAARGYTGDELPRTASPLALAGLLAGLSFAGVAAVRRFRR